ncbi:MAG TPA: chitobiase/beta-hexosaminidase C-terminal domain-containing protein, partial [Pyrinomonadaceae bacterium]
MRKSFLAFAACALLPLCSPTASATANNVYHEQSGDYVAQPVAGPGLPCAAAPDPVDEAGGVYADTADLSPSSPAPSGTVHVYPGAYTLRFKIEFQTQTNQARVFYTTDGTAPTAVANG